MVRPSGLGGLGVFALVDIEVGTIIHEEAPLFQCALRNLYHAFEALCMKDQARFLALHHWGGDKDYPVMGIFTTNRYVALEVFLIPKTFFPESLLIRHSFSPESSSH